MCEIVAEGVSLMLYGGVNGHTAGLVEHHKTLILKGNRHIQAAVWLKEAVILKAEDDYVPVIDRINAADSLVVPRNAAFLPFEPSQQPP